jgi:hypothetical protein
MYSEDRANFVATKLATWNGSEEDTRILSSRLKRAASQAQTSNMLNQCASVAATISHGRMKVSSASNVVSKNHYFH